MNGTAERPRVCVRFTNKNIHAQCIDDENFHTLHGIATTHPDHKDVLPNVAGAEKLGLAFGSRIKGAGVSRIVFDRSGRKYHGCVKAFADALRQEGLEF